MPQMAQGRPVPGGGSKERREAVVSGQPRLGRQPIDPDAEGHAAIAAFSSGSGLGNQIFRGISSLGSANTLNEVLSGTLGIVVAPCRSTPGTY
ncbi:hypothetical protein Stube_13510 [Streptomyces tubercidicus]|uniref:Uncharacterized protein n=1 Tax=Streptomyces tubercidicus TaxID=47759 RepID=A0A640UKQ5_9ACTN|nr:hypothetical protein Stube_13510 [Streptomyces tubercidicus]